MFFFRQNLLPWEGSDQMSAFWSLFWCTPFRNFSRKNTIFRKFRPVVEILSVSDGRPWSQGVCPSLVTAPLSSSYRQGRTPCWVGSLRPSASVSTGPNKKILRRLAYTFITCIPTTTTLNKYSESDISNFSSSYFSIWSLPSNNRHSLQAGTHTTLIKKYEINCFKEKEYCKG